MGSNLNSMGTLATRLSDWRGGQWLISDKSNSPDNFIDPGRICLSRVNLPQMWHSGSEQRQCQVLIEFRISSLPVPSHPSDRAICAAQRKGFDTTPDQHWKKHEARSAKLYYIMKNSKTTKNLNMLFKLQCQSACRRQNFGSWANRSRSRKCL